MMRSLRSCRISEGEDTRSERFGCGLVWGKVRRITGMEKTIYSVAATSPRWHEPAIALLRSRVRRMIAIHMCSVSNGDRTTAAYRYCDASRATAYGNNSRYRRSGPHRLASGASPDEHGEASPGVPKSGAQMCADAEG